MNALEKELNYYNSNKDELGSFLVHCVLEEPDLIQRFYSRVM